MKFTVVVQRTVLDTYEVEAKTPLDAERIVLNGEYRDDQFVYSDEAGNTEVVSVYSPTWAIKSV